jgi:hypothetical protein
MSKNLKEEKKSNPHARKILVQFKVNAEEMRLILGHAAAWTQGNISQLARIAVLKFRPAKGDLEK